MAIIDLEEELSNYQIPLGAVAQVAIYAEHLHHHSLLRKILLRMRRWEPAVNGPIFWSLFGDNAWLRTRTPLVGGEHTKAFPPLDPNMYAAQLVWLAISFGLLYVLVQRIFMPRVDAILEDRSGRIKNDFALAEKLKRDTEEALASYQQALVDARAKAHGVTTIMRENLAKETDKERARIEAQIAAMLAEAENRIVAAKSEALALMFLLDQDRAVEKIPEMLGKDFGGASRMADSLHRMIDVVGLHTSLAKARLQENDDLIELGTQREQPRAAAREAREHGTVQPGPGHATRSKHH